MAGGYATNLRSANFAIGGTLHAIPGQPIYRRAREKTKTMKTENLSDTITIINADCREWSGVADAVISDPPYGMSLDTDFSGMKGHKYAPVVGDDAPFDPSPWLSVGGSQVFWGAQYFCHRLPEVGGWLVFNKRGEGAPSEMCFGDCELAWCSVGQAVRMYSHMCTV